MTHKPSDYYATDRSDFLDWVGGTHRRVLDVGCGAGANAGWYRRHGAETIVGVEPDPASAASAAEVFDAVISESIESAMPRLTEPFDLVVCADVLEHLPDPWSVARQLADRAGPETVLAVSMPNIRFLPALARIGFGRGFEYEESGIFDSTHLRFFTRHDLDRMLIGAGWSAQRWGAPTFRRLGTVRRGIQRLSGGRSDQWLASQTYVLARPLARR